MAKLTPAKAAHHLRYCEREIALGRGTPRLAEIAEHRRQYLTRVKACWNCGESITNPDSLKAWELDRLGPTCRERMAVAS